MQIFYTPDIAVNPELPEEEAGHCIRVLRLTEGDEILLTDGKGTFYKAAISRAHHKHCEVSILESWQQPALWNFHLHIAVAPTKNMDRMEWFAEKATEIGIDAITCLNCRFSERREIKPARLEKILVSAMKQSQKATLPQLEGMTDFKSFVSQPFDGDSCTGGLSYDTCTESIKIKYHRKKDMLTEEIPLVRILFLFFFEPYFNTSMEKEERY